MAFSLKIPASEFAKATDRAAGATSPANVNASTPRRRLASAVSAAKSLQIEKMSEVVRLDSARVTGRIDAAEVVIARFGKKISGRYALVTAYYKKPTLRFVVYLSETCHKYELTCVHKAMEDSCDETKLDSRENAALVRMVANGLEIDKSGKLVFAAN